LILVTKNNCKNCEYVKSKIPAGLKLTIINSDDMTANEMALMAYHELIGHIVPVLIMDNEDLIEGTVNIKNALNGVD
jgi:hypothetical protein